MIIFLFLLIYFNVFYDIIWYIMRDTINLIYETHNKMLYNYLLRHVRNENDAFDIMQETFVKLIDNIEKIQMGKEKSWLFTVARNIMINNWKKYNKVSFSLLTNDDGTEVDIQDERYDVQNEYIKDVEKKCVEEQINKLKVKEKDVVIMKYINNLSINEIAEITKFTISNIKVKLFRARIKLKNLIMECCNG